MESVVYLGSSANRTPGMALAIVRGMVVPSVTSPPRYSIAQTEQGWVLVIQDEQCSVMQVFSSASSARRAVDRMLEFFQIMSAQAPRARQAA
jgi:hypothetical protein